MSTPSLAFMPLSCVRLRCVYTKPLSRFSLCHMYVLGAYTPSPSHVSVCLTCIPSRAFFFFFWSTPCMRPASLRETKKKVSPNRLPSVRKPFRKLNESDSNSVYVQTQQKGKWSKQEKKDGIADSRSDSGLCAQDSNQNHIGSRIRIKSAKG